MRRLPRSLRSPPVPCQNPACRDVAMMFSLHAHMPRDMRHMAQHRPSQHAAAAGARQVVWGAGVPRLAGGAAMLYTPHRRFMRCAGGTASRAPRQRQPLREAARGAREKVIDRCLVQRVRQQQR